MYRIVRLLTVVTIIVGLGALSLWVCSAHYDSVVTLSPSINQSINQSAAIYTTPNVASESRAE